MPATNLSADSQSVHLPTPAERHRFHVLDAMRGVAAVLVVAYHTPSVYFPFGGLVNTFLAVDFFFCLSGFVIAFSYEKRLRTSLGLSDFSAIRLIRLYPLYAFGISIAIARSALTTHFVLRDIHSNWSVAALVTLSFLLLPNLAVPEAGSPLFPFNGPAWSLFFELVANGVYSCLVKYRILRTGSYVVGVTSFALLTAVALRNGTLDFGANRSEIGMGLARIGFSFTAGTLLFRIYKAFPGHRLGGWISYTTTPVLLLLLVSSLTLSTAWSTTGIYQLLVVVLLFPALIYAGAHCVVPPVLTGLCVFLGDMSYPLYIVHAPLMLPFRTSSFVRMLTRHSLILKLSGATYILLLVFLCWLIGRFVDLPLRKRLTIAYRISRST